MSAAPVMVEKRRRGRPRKLRPEAPARQRVSQHALLTQIAERLERLIDEESPLTFAETAARQIRLLLQATRPAELVVDVLFPRSVRGRPKDITTLLAWASRVDDAHLTRKDS